MPKRKYEPNEIHDLEYIIESRAVGGTREFLCKWVGWNNAYNTWEPRRNLYPGDIEAFEKGHADDDDVGGQGCGAAQEEKVACRPSVGMRQARVTAAASLGRKEKGGELRHELRGCAIDIKAAVYPEVALAIFLTMLRLSGQTQQPQVSYRNGTACKQLIIWEIAIVARILQLDLIQSRCHGALRLKGGRAQNEDLFVISMPLAVTVRWPARNKKGDLRECDNAASLKLQYNITKFNGMTGQIFPVKAKKSEAIMNTPAQLAEITKYTKATLKEHYPAHTLVVKGWCKRGAPACLGDDEAMPSE